MTPTLLTHRTKPTPGGPAGLHFTAKKTEQQRGQHHPPQKANRIHPNTPQPSENHKTRDRERQEIIGRKTERLYQCLYSRRQRRKKGRNPCAAGPLSNLAPSPALTFFSRRLSMVSPGPSGFRANSRPPPSAAPIMVPRYGTWNTPFFFST